MKQFALGAAVGFFLFTSTLSAAGAPRLLAPQTNLVVRILPSTADPHGGADLRIKRPVADEGCDRVPRSAKDRTDVQRGKLVHIIYLVPADALDESLDMRGTLACSIESQNEWFEEASGGFRWRFDTFRYSSEDANQASEIADVTFVRSKLTGADLGDGASVEAELRALGFNDPDKRYLSYVAAQSGACGDAAYPISFSPGSPVDGHYAQVYLKSDKACGAEDFGTIVEPGLSEAIAQQELIHNDGLTSPGAPHGCLGGIPPGVAHVCTGPLFLTEANLNLDPERFDVMYPYVSVPLAEKVLDIGNDDYFKHSLPHLFDLQNSPYLERAKAR